VRGMEEREVLGALSGVLGHEHRLVVAQSVRRLGEQQLSRYRFRHYLFQLYLYQRLDDAERVRLHEEVGHALEALYGATPRSVFMDMAPIRLLVGEHGDPETIRWLRTGPAVIASQLARHFQMAELGLKALAYLWQAAERAMALYAFEEAVLCLGRALEMLPTLPDTPQRARLEFNLCHILSDALRNTNGHFSPKVHHVHARAGGVAQQIGDAVMLSLALRDLACHHRQRGELCLARELGERSVLMSQGQAPVVEMAMHNALAQTLLLCGDFAGASQHLESASAPCWGPQPPLAGRLYDNYLYDLARAPWALWCLGYPARALKVSQTALVLAHSMGDPSLIAQALCDAVCFLHQLRREAPAIECALHELLPLISEGKCYPTWRPCATLYLGWVHTQAGMVEQGIEELRQGLAVWSAWYMALRPHWLALLAEALARAGRVEEGLGALAEALEQVERTGERFSEAELHRLRGELLLQRGASEAEIEACFQQAIAVARQQEAKSWELRATVSLCRLWQRQGKRDQAQRALAAIYSWFTEGFDAPDLAGAGALLAGLAAGGE